MSVSDYALVMDKYEFSMKDLLERGPGEAYWVAPSVLEEVFTRDNVPEALTAITPPAPISNGWWTSRRRSNLSDRQRLRDAIEAAAGRIRVAQADDVRRSHPHGLAVSCATSSSV